MKHTIYCILTMLECNWNIDIALLTLCKDVDVRTGHMVNDVADELESLDVEEEQASDDEATKEETDRQPMSMDGDQGQEAKAKPYPEDLPELTDPEADLESSNKQVDEPSPLNRSQMIFMKPSRFIHVTKVSESE
jgi:hypothetical protein